MTRSLPTDPRRLTVPAVLVTTALALLLGGPVAALIAAVYTFLTTRALTRRAERHRAADLHTRSLDTLCALAADLRSGLPPAAASSRSTRRRPADPGGTALIASRPARPGPAATLPGLAATPPGDLCAAPTDPRVAALTDAVWRLAERTGAPAADLVDRIESDLRAAARARTAAAAQAAGARVTALLLAALPPAGIALGQSIGADALNVLLHTVPGALCAAGAVVLQCAGLAWSDRLITGATR